MTHNKSVTLALGSGGARGIAHIGVIKWLKENGYAIHSVAGSSIGALIGGIYAANGSPKYDGTTIPGGPFVYPEYAAAGAWTTPENRH